MSAALDRCRAFAVELEALRRGEVTIEALSERHPSTADEDFEEVLSSLCHWVADADVRAADPDYRTMQESEFDRLVALVRAGRMTEAAGVTFLGGSADFGAA